MMPYIYSLAGMTHFNDYTMMRPLIMDYSADKKVINIKEQYMFGPSLMVCPVYEYGARELAVYLPETTVWYDFYTGQSIGSGNQIVKAEYERIPLFVPAGAIMPYGPDLQYSDEKPADNINLYVYAGANGSFTLYEDENVNYNYEKGAFSTIEFVYDNDKKQLTIGGRKGEFPGMLNERTFNIVLVDNDKAQKFDLSAKGVSVRYTGAEQNVKL